MTTLEQAYGFCREVARREAKNFYYAFRVLPKAKSDAMCAVYAFMRRADDIADDETKSVQERRDEMAAWLRGWRDSRGADWVGDDLVFVALGDTQRRFGIGDELLEQLVRGTTMDLEAAPAGVVRVDAGGKELQVYETFDDLYQYCYLVASVVGLVCIRIFGYSDPAAEMYAERTGIAFQLTNILRDVKEDAERGRVYLPREMLHEYGVSVEDVALLAGGKALRANERAMLVGLSVQAWEYYEAAWRLLPLIDRDSRAALWVLVKIYSGLLGKIDEQQGDVFSRRVSLPAQDKLMLLGRGMFMAAKARLG